MISGQLNPAFLGVGVVCLSSLNMAMAQSKQQSFRYDYDEHGRQYIEQIADSAVLFKQYSNHSMAMDISVLDEHSATQIINQIELDKDGSAKKVHFGESANVDYSLRTTDAFSRQINAHLYRLGSPMLRENNMVYDAAGRLKQYYRYQQNDAADVFKYNYDDMGKLTRFSVGGQWNDYGYDEQGNLNYKSGLSAAGYQIAHLPRQAYNSDNQNVTHVYWRYDDEGNLIEDEQYDNDGNLIRDEQYIYKYNAANRLVMVLDSKTQKWLSHYLYDSSGNRVRKITPDVTTYYFRNVAGHLAYEEVYNTATNELIKKVRYVGANGANVASISTSAQGERTVEYQYNNRLNSQSVRWDDKGNLSMQEYSPYGEQMKVTATHHGAFGFTGHEDDVETNSIYMKARHYQSAFGRMNRPDPGRDFDIFNPSSFNLYAYVGNDPVNAWDPTGLHSEQCKKDGTCKVDMEIQVTAELPDEEGIVIDLATQHRHYAMNLTSEAEWQNRVVKVANSSKTYGSEQAFKDALWIEGYFTVIFGHRGLGNTPYLGAPDGLPLPQWLRDLLPDNELSFNHEQIYIITPDGTVKNIGYTAGTGLFTEDIDWSVIAFSKSAYVTKDLATSAGRYSPMSYTADGFFIHGVPGNWAGSSYNLITNNCQFYCFRARQQLERRR